MLSGRLLLHTMPVCVLWVLRGRLLLHTMPVCVVGASWTTVVTYNACVCCGCFVDDCCYIIPVCAMCAQMTTVVT